MRSSFRRKREHKIHSPIEIFQWICAAWHKWIWENVPPTKLLLKTWRFCNRLETPIKWTEHLRRFNSAQNMHTTNRSNQFTVEKFQAVFSLLLYVLFFAVVVQEQLKALFSFSDWSFIFFRIIKHHCLKKKNSIELKPIAFVFAASTQLQFKQKRTKNKYTLYCLPLRMCAANL